MRVLFDQGTPVPLRQFLTQHEVTTAFERGWSKLKNGDLLDAAEKDGFAALVTTDLNLKYKQNLTAPASGHRGVKDHELAAHSTRRGRGRSRGG